MERDEKEKIIFWLHRVLEEKCMDLKNISDRIGILNHQIAHFKDMRIEVQEDVMKELIEDLSKYEWLSAYKEMIGLLERKEGGKEE